MALYSSRPTLPHIVVCYIHGSSQESTFQIRQGQFSPQGLHHFVYIDIDSTAPRHSALRLFLLCPLHFHAFVMVIPLSTVMVYSVLSGVLFVRLWVPGLGIRDGFHHWKNRSWITYHFGWAGKGGLFLEIYDMNSICHCLYQE